MRHFSMLASAVFGVGMLMTLSPLSGCGSTNKSAFGNGDGGSAGSGNANGGGGGTGGVNLGGGSAGSGGSTGGGGSAHACLSPGITCDVPCSGGSKTTVSGTVYDPARRDPLYDISVYVPAMPLTPLPQGVPTGADACSCGALYKSGAIVATSTAVDGTFTLSNVPVGDNVPLVIQVGKWRRQFNISVTACEDNTQPDKSLALPNAIASGDTIDNMPDIAVSTGNADTLECLMTRIGLPTSEYVAGTATGGHIHVFNGGQPGPPGSGYDSPGAAETHQMAAAPTSWTDLWASQDALMPYDIVLLSCEGGETYNANPPALEAYLNAGGRAFASHFHYAWFSGPIGSKQSYSAPSDWGTNLASWAVDVSESNGPVSGVIDETLNGSTTPFAKGIALDQWLGDVKALGGFLVPSSDLAIFAPRYNAVVSASDTPSQPWITSGSHTMYFSFDTPVGASQVCGRAVYSDLHVSGAPSTNDSENNEVGSPPPNGCDAKAELSPQEKALEFMLFDLSSCVIPDSQPPPSPDAGLPPPPK
jgi:hypothetical protein